MKGFCAPHWRIIEPMQGRIAVDLYIKASLDEEFATGTSTIANDNFLSLFLFECPIAPKIHMSYCP